MVLKRHERNTNMPRQAHMIQYEVEKLKLWKVLAHN